ncbi:MAG TPA: TIGR04282 family arsenosugar biosynthesis glycosyltransferase [Gammaproteobacteria bacterium]|nr:TIGR04282 family arsenosugar biosynthesis glycosyltransferase [Gammaproteobacteria bacterium]
MPEPRCPILVFAKAPVPGLAKTRLIPALGATGAADLQRRLTHAAVRRALDADIGPVQLWCSPDLEHQFFDECREAYPSISLHPQQGADLGTRMAHALQTALATGTSGALLIGTDCPALSPEDLRQGRDALRGGAQVVLSPAEDGGYVLVGVASLGPDSVRRLFDDVPWGTDQVLAITRQRIADNGLRGDELPTRWDIDRHPDLQRLAADPALRGLLHGLWEPCGFPDQGDG